MKKESKRKMAVSEFEEERCFKSKQPAHQRLWGNASRTLPPRTAQHQKIKGA
jgi:hypothetical protein